MVHLYLCPAFLVSDGIWVVVAGLYLGMALLLIQGARKVGAGNGNVNSMSFNFTFHYYLSLYALNFTPLRRGPV